MTVRPLKIDRVRTSEVMVVGTGVAGLAAALGSSPRAVTVLTKSRLGEGGSSAWAQGGVAAAVGEDDSPELHAADTLAVAGGLGDPEVVEVLTREGPVRIGELIALGARFDRAEGGDGRGGSKHLVDGLVRAGELGAASASGADVARQAVEPPADREGRPRLASDGAPAGKPGAAWASGVAAASEAFQPSANREARSHQAAGASSAGKPGVTCPSGAGTATADLSLGREAAHSRRRILHAGGDATGAELVRALTRAVVNAPGVRVEEECFAIDLVVDAMPGGGHRVVGVVTLDGSGRRTLHLAGAVVLATGGLGQLYAHTTNPSEVTGDGLAMAARAGARLVDLEMVQFHPTALAAAEGAAEADSPHSLLTEALRGEGAVLIDSAGHRFMLDEHPDAELAPRDVVARAIHRRREAGEAVYLDARAVVGERFPERFPTVFEKAMAAGIDPRVEALPVTPAAHYHMGGIATDGRGRSSLPGLWVCGEAASTGAHGANRLASNSLLEALVFGARVAGDTAARLTGLPGIGRAQVYRLRAGGRRLEVAGPDGPEVAGTSAEAAAGDIAAAETASFETASAETASTETNGAPANLEPAGRLLPALRALRRRLRREMWRHAGLLRDEAGLWQGAEALDALSAEAAALAAEIETAGSFAERAHLHETLNLLLSGRLVVAAALARPESRGAHHRDDRPATNPAWRRHLYAGVNDAGRIEIAVGALLPDAIEDEGAAQGSAGPAVARSADEAAARTTRRAPSTGTSRRPLAPPAVAAWGGPQ